MGLRSRAGPPVRPEVQGVRGLSGAGAGTGHPPATGVPGKGVGGGAEVRGRERNREADGSREAAAPEKAAAPRPPSLAVGIGAGRGVGGDEVIALIERTLAGAGLSLRSVTALATVDAKAGEPGLLAAADRLDLPLRTYAADVLAAVDVPNPSGAPQTAVGTPSVAEAAALTAAGEDGRLVVPKSKPAPLDGTPAPVTVAVARGRPPGRGRRS
ncbi:cobalamin biosynthesis protein [Streptomyces sp. HNM0575]|nr:cobalamin biosynthesis protein [Streptomyces sp. HNM0575]